MESLTAEVEKDLLSGVDSHGNLKFAAFTGVARKLGASHSQSCGQVIPFNKKRLRDLQIEAATRREQNFNRSHGSGQVLGGRVSSSNTSASSGIPSSSRLLQINQIRETKSGIENQSQSQRGNNLTSTQDPLGAHNLPTSLVPHPTTVEVTWSCVSCTYENPSSNSQCEICGALPRDGESWCCPQCTFENSFPVDTCSVCGGDRWSSLLPSHDGNLPNPSATLPDIVILLEDDIQPKSAPSRRLRGKSVEDSHNDVECLWICSLCQGANEMRETSCTICGYLA